MSEGDNAVAIAGLEVGLPDNGEAVSADWLTKVLHTSGSIDAATTVASVDCQRWDAGGLLSALYKAHLTFAGGSGPASLVLKFPMDIPHQRGMADAFGVYPKEVGWYREIAPRSNIRIPQVHAAMINDDHSNYCIVLEDLSHLRQADRINGMSWEEGCAAIDALADYHAAWTGSDELAGMSERFFGWGAPVYRGGLPQVAAGGWPAAIAHASDLISSEVKELGDSWVELLPKMLNLMETELTLCHNDWRADNLFVADDGGIVAIDPQICGVANRAVDIGYFITQSLERDVRGGREQELVQRYVDRSATHGVAHDFDGLFRDVRVSVALVFVYGFASFTEYENLDPNSQDAQRNILRRAAQAVEDFGALAAARDL